jgi:hypothetical protein
MSGTMKPTLKEYLSQERLNRINRAWKYLKPWQRAWIYVRAVWWALPDEIEIMRWVRNRIEVWVTYRIYKAHWVK